MKHISVNDSRCTGCSACEHICPKKCIRMKSNEEGFLYPVIDKNSCIECGKCKTVCSIEQTSHKNSLKKQAYACRSKNDKAKEKSSSGGIFFELANYFTDDGGYVCGAEYDENFSVKHNVISSSDEISGLMKSKYIQSDLNDSFIRIRDLLKKDKYVLFIGTPCQVKGLRLFLHKDFQNLVCGEVVCHGVPSYKVLKKYTDYISNGSKLTGIDFRDKKTGWKNYSVRFCFENGYEWEQTHDKCLYITGFINDLYLRKSCYTCSCKIANSYADFTLGDLWGAECLISDADDCGISLYIPNTEKGMELLNKISDKIDFRALDNDDYLKYNPSISTAAGENPKRNEFFKNIDKYNFGMLWDYVHSVSKLQKLKIRLKSKI